MAFQSHNLVAAALGVPDGTDTDGPRLAEGIHLRWTVAREVGFPWHGFHVFRREHDGGRSRRLSWHLRKEQSHDTGHRVYFAPDLGVGSSDGDIVIAARDGAPQGFDLEGRSWLQFSLLGMTAHRVTVHVALHGATTAVEVEAYSSDELIARDTAAGQPGGTASVTFAFDSITRIVVRGASATLYEMEVALVTDGASNGWEEVPTFRYPLRLPLAHSAYPPPEGITSVDEARQLAIKRVAGAGDFVDPSWVAFEDLHEQLADLAEEVAGGGRMADRVLRVPDPDGTGGQADVDVAMLQRPLDLVLLACLDPTIAQMVGLYWVDTTAEDRFVYDYLVIGDHGNPEGFVRGAVLDEGMHPADIPDTDSYITFRHRLMDVPPLRAPDRVELYALPDAGSRARVDRGQAAGSNRVGVRWELGASSATSFHPEQPAMFHLLRADLGEAQPDAEPGVHAFNPVTKAPIVVARPADGTAAVDRPDGWPDVRLLAVDVGLADGWYSYRVAGLDLFGRQSPPSPPGRWRQWAPAPQPRPWYQQGTAAGVVHPYAVCLRDETPPPPPIDVEAQALDPAADQRWRADLADAGTDSVVGAAVRWKWPARYAQQAPDVIAFRVHYQVGMLNVLRGTTVEVAAGGPGERVVTTDIADTLPDDAYEGLSVRIGAATYRIVGSESPGTLKLRIGGNEGGPHAGEPCAIGLRGEHPRHIDFHDPARWQAHWHTVEFDDHARVETVGGEVVRHYEVRLPELAPGAVEGLPIEATLEDPVVYAHLGVTAVRDDPEPVELPGPGGGPPAVIDDFRTESPVGNPAPVYVVLRDRPAPPAPAHTDGEELVATRADYHGHSYFTHRWRPSPQLRAHVYRALDEAVFRTDLRLRPRGHIDADDPIDRALFPEDWVAGRVEQIASELNDLDDLIGGANPETAGTAYRGLSNDAVRVLAGLPGTARAFSQRTIDPLDPDDAATADRRGPDDAEGYEPDDDLRCYVDQLDGRSSSRFLYRTAYVDPAQNRSDLGLSSPPVVTPKVTPPRMPSVAKVAGGDCRVVLQVAHPAGTDAVAYRVFRADDEHGAADLRRMDEIATVDVSGDTPTVGADADADASLSPGGSLTIEVGAPGLRTLWYRVVAVDAVGNRSRPSPALPARAFDESPPTVPDLTASWDVSGGAAHAQLSWHTEDTETRVQRRTGMSGPWADVTDWLDAGPHDVQDDRATPDTDLQYRLWARKATGAIAKGQPTTLPATSA